MQPLVFLNDFAPPNPRHKYTYLQELSLTYKIQCIAIIMAIILDLSTMLGKNLPIQLIMTPLSSIA